jgi:hypothetical protein
VEIGGTQTVSGAQVTSWARAPAGDRVTEIGVVVPFEVIENPPETGNGPAGAIAVVPFPAGAQRDTGIDHFEMHWQPQGHPPTAFEVPHFDFHFYMITEDAVRAIKARDAEPLPQERMPPGYVDAGEVAFVPEMGTHLLDPKDLEKPFTVALIEGAHGGQIIFVEPMVTRAFLEEKRSFTVEVPQPASFEKPTPFPKTARFDWIPDQNAYQVVLTDFEEHS